MQTHTGNKLQAQYADYGDLCSCVYVSHAECLPCVLICEVWLTHTHLLTSPAQPQPPPNPHTHARTAMGYNLTNRMPLFVAPTVKISTLDVMKYMRNHFEDSSLDFSQVMCVCAFERTLRRSFPPSQPHSQSKHTHTHRMSGQGPTICRIGGGPSHGT